MRKGLRIVAFAAIVCFNAPPAYSEGNVGPHFAIPERDARIYRARAIENGRMVSMELPSPIVLGATGEGRTIPRHVALEVGSAIPPKFSLGKNKLCSDLVTINLDPGSISNIKPLRFRTLFDMGPQLRADYIFLASTDGSLFAHCNDLTKTCDVISLNEGWDSEITIVRGDLCQARAMSEKLKEKVKPWFKAG